MRAATQSRLTPPDERYATCERTCAKLRIYSGDLTPHDVSARLLLEPMSVVRKGVAVTNSLGRTRVGKLNGWFLSSEGSVESKDVRHHLDWLLAKLEPAVDALRALQDQPGVQMAVTCIWWARSGDGGPTLWPEQMEVLARLNLECGFELAFYDNEATGDGGQLGSSAGLQRASAKAEDLLSFLYGRGLAVSAEQRSRILASTDLDELSRWVRKAATVASTDELFTD